MDLRNDESAAIEERLRELTTDTGVRMAFVCELVPRGVRQARTRALAFDGEFLENRTYEIAGTPCSRVYEQGVLYHSHGLPGLYPEDKDLVEWGVDSYLGVAITDTTGEQLGHVGVMHDRCFEDPTAIETKVRSLAHDLSDLFTGNAN